MTLAEWHAAIDGFIRAHTPREADIGEDEFLNVLSEEMAAGRA
ncbi:hypothetical protein [Methylobacterium nodulans]|uniref:Uncharacterized protein n=1 Tax=Methylobacterium nodulans (strain LMG 21967 / CNCM I-2342 / ORS 2060) TaxID=460265 RepID=B8ITA8_METNO|nr:hypothetical protein [Methylobacterium nodulans]ACL56994.1 hypothetical protein Mnod_2007 [Methylobacterium nodulans ORS 2060]